MQDSLFTKIINRQLPAEILYEDDMSIVILTIAPHNPGHCLIIPKSQIVDWQDLPQELYLHCMLLVKAMASIIDHIYEPKKLSIVTVGFEVPHVHIHLIPINQTTDIDSTNARQVSAAELKTEADKIRQQIAKSGIELGKF